LSFSIDATSPLRSALSAARLTTEMVQFARLMASPDVSRTAKVYDFLSTHNSLSERSHYVNMGYWKNATTFDDACEAMAMLVAEAAGFQPGHRIVDAGYGFGDQDLAWIRRCGVQITGFNITQSQVRVARRRVREARLGGGKSVSFLERPDWARRRVREARLGGVIDLRLGSALDTGLPSSSVDAVVAVESAFHFPSRPAFFREAHRLLKPEGRLALADLVLKPDVRSLRQRATLWASKRFWQMPEENLYGIEVYTRHLHDAGFVDVQVQTITDDVFPPFAAYAQKRKHQPDVVARANPLMRAMWGNARGHTVFDYVIVSARRA
jgi:cyclopropane fatty-acyl-phospholipid synthase-like methyltransferase